MSQDINVKSIGPALKDALGKITRYSGLLFFVFVATIYAFVLWRINDVANGDSSVVDASGQTTIQNLHVDPKVVDQLQQLQDNSVNVQKIFEESRNNPFQE